MSADRAAADGRPSTLTGTGRERLRLKCAERDRKRWQMKCVSDKRTERNGNKETASIGWLHAGDAAASARWRECSKQDKWLSFFSYSHRPSKYFMPWQKERVIPRMETSSWAPIIHVNHCSHLSHSRLAGGNWATLFYSILSFFRVRCQVLLYWKHFWPYLFDFLCLQIYRNKLEKICWVF